MRFFMWRTQDEEKKEKKGGKNGHWRASEQIR
jgi:hypothetical protein